MNVSVNSLVYGKVVMLSCYVYAPGPSWVEGGLSVRLRPGSARQWPLRLGGARSGHRGPLT